jgi:hypothetical protein
MSWRMSHLGRHRSRPALRWPLNAGNAGANWSSRTVTPLFTEGGPFGEVLEPVHNLHSKTVDMAVQAFYSWVL